MKSQLFLVLFKCILNFIYGYLHRKCNRILSNKMYTVHMFSICRDQPNGLRDIYQLKSFLIHHNVFEGLV